MNDTYEDLVTARAILSDIKYSIKITKQSCSECGTDRWDDWKMYQVRSSLDSALTRVEKAMEIINGIK
tara:strand:- start:21 stop:224 length:204 start_codon:yes stop_codon:yes gene_type:complete